MVPLWCSMFLLCSLENYVFKDFTGYCSFCLTGALYLLVHSTAPLHLSACLGLCRYASGMSTLLGEPHQSVLMGNSSTLVNKGSFRVTVKHNHLFHAVRRCAKLTPLSMDRQCTNTLGWHSSHHPSQHPTAGGAYSWGRGWGEGVKRSNRVGWRAAPGWREKGN